MPGEKAPTQDRNIVHTSETARSGNRAGSMSEDQRRLLLERVGQGQSEEEVETPEDTTAKELFTPEEKAETEQLRQKLIEDVFNPQPIPQERPTTLNNTGKEIVGEQLGLFAPETPVLSQEDIDRANALRQELVEDVFNPQVSTQEATPEVSGDPYAEAYGVPTDTPNIYEINDTGNEEASSEDAAETSESTDDAVEVEQEQPAPAVPEAAPATAEQTPTPESAPTIPPIPEGTRIDTEPTPIAAQVAAEQARPRGVSPTEWRQRRADGTGERARPVSAEVTAAQRAEAFRAQLELKTPQELMDMVMNLLAEVQRQQASQEGSSSERSGRIPASELLAREGVDTDAEHHKHKLTRQERRERRKNSRFGRGVLRAVQWARHGREWFGEEARDDRRDKRRDNKKAKHQSKIDKIDKAKEGEAINKWLKAERQYKREKRSGQLSAQTEYARRQRQTEGGTR